MTTAEVPRRRRWDSVADMARSLGLMVVVLGATLIFVPQLFHPGKSARYPAQDYSNYLIGFRDLTGRAALAPAGLPAGWQANASALSGNRSTAHLHVGFAVPGSKYVGLEESVQPPAVFVSTLLGRRASSVTGTTTINGLAWQRRSSAAGELALSRDDAGLTVVVTGSGSPEQIQRLAGSLR